MGNEFTFRVRGPISPDIQLHPLRPLVHGPETELQGVLVDQAALHAIIARLQGLGVELVALLQRLADDRSAASAKA